MTTHSKYTNHGPDRATLNVGFKKAYLEHEVSEHSLQHSNVVKKFVKVGDGPHLCQHDHAFVSSCVFKYWNR